MTVDFNTFLEKLYNLNADGDPDDLYQWVLGRLEAPSPPMMPGGKAPLTFDILVEKYEEYINHWDMTEGTKDPKYRTEKNKKVRIDHFINKGLYKQSFNAPKNPQRDEYLFGNGDRKVMLKGLQDFKNKIIRYE